MGEIFISYRRDDSAGHAGRIFDHLVAAFGKDCVFLDIDDIRPGQVFPDVIRDRITGCAAAIVVIGRQWLEILRSRAGTTGDYVSTEIQAALKSGAVVIPVLVQGAPMPPASALPESLAEFALREALELRDASFTEDVACLVNAVKDIPGLQGRQLPLDLAGTWIASMAKRGQPPYRMILHFEVFGENLYGTVEYPSGEGAIQEARLDDRRLSFHTTHVPQFESTPAVIRIEGEIVGDEIHLVAASDSGVARGVASRRAASS